MSDLEQEAPKPYKSGFVGIVGPTNAGKSTLLNTLIGSKVSIVSDKAQTTYNNVRGILNAPDYQLVFVDTPGLQNYSENVARLLNKVASQAASDCDCLVWVFDASRSLMMKQLEKLAPKIRSLKSPAESICVLNKVDKMEKGSLLPLLEKIAAMELFSEMIPLSAKKGSNVDRLVSTVLARVKEGPPFFAKDAITDRSMEFLLKEAVREKIYEATHQEIPYSVYVEMEASIGEHRVPEYRAVLHVDSPSRKAILVGKGGLMLKNIGIKARKDMEKLLGRQICLRLHVDLEPDWKSDGRLVENLLELN